MENKVFNWGEVVDFFSKKYILTRASFTNSTAEVIGDKVSVNLGAKGKFMLLSKNIDKTVSDFIFNTTGKRYQIDFVEPDGKRFIESRENVQDSIIKQVIEDNNKRKLELENQKIKEKEEKLRSKVTKNFGNINNNISDNSQSPYTGFVGPSDEELNSLLSEVDIGDLVEQNNNLPPISFNSIPNKPNYDYKPKKNANNDNVKDVERLIFKSWHEVQNPKEVKIINLAEESPKVIITGEVYNKSVRETKNGSFLVSFDIYDGTSAINCKAFMKSAEYEESKSKFDSIKAARVVGTYEYNNFSKEFGITAEIIEEADFEKITRMDNSEEKRVELHLHTQMSQMDAVTSAEDLIKRAIMWGHKAIAITDHGVVQAFPDANKAVKGAVKKAQEKAQKKVEEEYATKLSDESLSEEEKEKLQKERDEAIDKAKAEAKKKNDIKVIYGVEAYLVPDGVTSTFDFKEDQSIQDETYCILDIETTGISKLTEKITEFGIMKVKNGEVIDTFECFVNPEKPIPPRVVEVTNITDEMVKDADTIDIVLPKVIEFCKDTTIVAHNASFDVGFIKENARRLGLEFNYPWIDTLALAKELFPERKKFKLGLIAEDLGIKVDVAHRALADVDTLKKVFDIMLDMLDKKDIKKFKDVDLMLAKDINYKTLPTYHAIILATNKVGLKNLYKLVSFAHLDYYYKKPKTLKSLLKKYSEGLIIGSACEQGELYRAIEEGKSDEELEEIADYYDYLEIQPLGNNMFKVRNGTVPNVETLQNYNKKIVELGNKLDKLVVATCDVHFMEPEDEMYRRILEAGQGYDDADDQAPLYFRTTEEMLREFEYLGKEKAYEIVVTNTNKIADMCEKICPIADYKAAPHIEGCEDTIRNITMTRAHELY